MGDRVQRQRFELKYVVPEDVAVGVRNFVQSYLFLDEYGATRPDLSYPVHSLYLDSEDLRLYRSTINGDKNRYKMRLRYYEDGDNSPVFFEIKRRNDNSISKLRGRVRREAVDYLLAGQLPEYDDLCGGDAEELAAIHEFHRRMMDIQASPKAHVAYLREAWTTEHSNAIRVTMDRRVSSEPEYEFRLKTEQQDPLLVFGDDVVLELKFTDRFPNWMRELVRVFGLRQRSAGKYVDGVANTPADKLAPWHAVYV